MFFVCAGQCPTVSGPENGRVSLSGHSVGDRATFMCDTGYQLVGDQAMNCLSNGTWDSSPPVCSGMKHSIAILKLVKNYANLTHTPFADQESHSVIFFQCCVGDDGDELLIIITATAAATLVLIVAVLIVAVIVKRRRKKPAVQCQEHTYDYPFHFNDHHSTSASGISHLQLKGNIAYHHGALLLPIPPQEFRNSPGLKQNVAYGALPSQQTVVSRCSTIEPLY